MSLIKSIGVGVVADTRNFSSPIKAAIQDLNALERSFASAQASAAGFKLGAVSGQGHEGAKGGASADFAASAAASVGLIGAQIAAGLQTATAPLNTFAATFSRQFDVVGGTIVEVSQRVASALRVIGAQSLQGLYKGRAANPETFGVDVNKKTFQDVINRSAQQAIAVRSVASEFDNLHSSESKLDTRAFDGIGKALNLISLSLDTATANMDRLGRAAESTARQMTSAARAARGIQGFGGPGGTQPKVKRKASGERPDLNYKGLIDRSGVPPVAEVVPEIARANTALRATEQAVTQVRDRTRETGAAAEAWTSKFRIDKKFASFLDTKSVVKGLGMTSKEAGKISFGPAITGARTLRKEVVATAPAVNTVSAGVKNLGTQIGLALGVTGLIYKATTAMASFFRTGISGASDLNESMSKNKEVFGKSAGVITAQADALAKSYGFVRGAIIDAADSFGLVIQGAGKTETESAKMSRNLVQLAADASSFYNVSMETALEKIRSGLVGEAEPLRAFGVLLSETAVKAEAARMGIAKGKGTLSETAKVTARYSLIQRGLATASGDLKRTQGEVANQFRKAGGGVENFAISVGQILLPAVKVGTVAFNELLFSIVEVFEANRPMIEGWGATIASVVDGAGMALRNWSDFGAIAFLKVREGFANVIATAAVVPSNLAIIGNYIAGNWRELVVDSVNAVTSVFRNLGTNLGNLGSAIYGFLQDPTQGFQFEWTPFLEGFKATAAQLPELIKPELVSMQGEIDTILGRIGAREAARTKMGEVAKKATKGPMAGAEDAKKKKGKKDKDVGALELGSKEAVSAVAKFRNTGTSAKPQEETAKNTANLVKLQRETLAYLKRAKDSKDPVKLAIANL